MPQHLGHRPVSRRHNNVITLSRLTRWVLGTFAMTLHGAVFAQVAENAPDNTGATTPVATLQAIRAGSATDEVTTEGTLSYTPRATRAGTGLSLSLRETPQSVTVVTRQRIEDQNMLSVKDVLAATPGISVQNYDTERYGFNSRGFSIDTYLYDGIPTALTGGGGWAAGESSIDPIIYDRIEVVRGATGLLTGAGLT